MSVKTEKASHKNGKATLRHKRVKAQEAADFEAYLTSIVNDPDAPLIAKELAALRLERDKSGEPYITVEQMWKELGRN